MQITNNFKLLHICTNRIINKIGKEIVLKQRLRKILTYVSHSKESYSLKYADVTKDIAADIYGRYCSFAQDWRKDCRSSWGGRILTISFQAGYKANSWTQVTEAAAMEIVEMVLSGRVNKVDLNFFDKVLVPSVSAAGRETYRGEKMYL